MILGIVGHEQAKFTEETEAKARDVIRRLISNPLVNYVSSGHCHLGGIDLWAEEIAQELDRFDERYIFAPTNLYWDTGYKPRNIRIAVASDHVVSIVVATLPDGFRGMRHKLCYHCGVNTHVKSGGCWTVKYAVKHLHKTGEVIVI